MRPRLACDSSARVSWRVVREACSDWPDSSSNSKDRGTKPNLGRPASAATDPEAANRSPGQGARSAEGRMARRRATLPR